MDVNKLITTSEAAKILDTSPSYVARLCREEKLVANQFGKSWLIDPASVEAYKAAPKDKGGRPRKDAKI